MILALNEDGSMPGEPLPFIEAITWFFIAPVGIFLAVWLLVVAAENVKAKKKRVKQDVLTRINE
ncbi:MAG: hypothetical protein ACKOOJ_05580 [Actinomycetota bacterium]